MQLLFSNYLSSFLGLFSNSGLTSTPPASSSLSSSEVALDIFPSSSVKKRNRIARLSQNSNSLLRRIPSAVIVHAFSYLAFEELACSCNISSLVAAQISPLASTHYIFSRPGRVTDEIFAKCLSKGQSRIRTLDLSDTLVSKIQGVLSDKMPALTTLCTPIYPSGYSSLLENETKIADCLRHYSTLTSLTLKGFKLNDTGEFFRIVFPHLTYLNLENSYQCQRFNELENMVNEEYEIYTNECYEKNAQQFAKEMAMLAENSPRLESLQLSGINAISSDFVSSLAFPNLKFLDISFVPDQVCKRRENWNVPLLSLSINGCPNLETLIARSFKRIDLALLKLAKLKELNLCGGSFFENVDALAINCPNLTHLNVMHPIMSRAEYFDLSSINHPMLKSLSFSSPFLKNREITSEKIEENFLAFTRQCVGLRSLKILTCAFDNVYHISRGMLSNLKHLKDLKNLSICDSLLAGENIKIVSEACPQLTELTLHTTTLVIEELGMALFPKLIALSLMSPKVSDGVCALISKNYPELQCLTLYWESSRTEEIMQRALRQLSLPKLTKLEIVSFRPLTEYTFTFVAELWGKSPFLNEIKIADLTFKRAGYLKK